MYLPLQIAEGIKSSQAKLTTRSKDQKIKSRKIAIINSCRAHQQIHPASEGKEQRMGFTPVYAKSNKYGQEPANPYPKAKLRHSKNSRWKMEVDTRQLLFKTKSFFCEKMGVCSNGPSKKMAEYQGSADDTQRRREDKNNTKKGIRSSVKERA